MADSRSNLAMGTPIPNDGNDHKCWMCKEGGATVCTEPQPPDNEEWWFHRDCYWKLQDILYG